MSPMLHARSCFCFLLRLDERKRRKEFVLERNLLYPDQFELSLSAEERQIYNKCKVFARFHSKEEHKELIQKVIEERRILRRIQDLQVFDAYNNLTKELRTDYRN